MSFTASCASNGSVISERVIAARSWPGQIALEPHPVIGRLRVGARVHHAALGVEPDETVARAGARVRGRPVLDGGIGAVADHLAQIVGAREIGRSRACCAPADATRRCRGSAPRSLVAAAHRNRLAQRHRVSRVPASAGTALVTCGRAAPRITCGCSISRGDRADRVLDDHRRRGRRAGTARRRPRLAAVAHRARCRTHSSRSAKDRSASNCQSPTTRCRWSTAVPGRSVCSASSSLSVDTVAPYPRMYRDGVS